MKLTAQDRATLLSIMERFPRQRVVMLGDLVADEYVYGEIARVSREAPVLILKQREKQVAPGGGANAANNLADLGAQVIPVSVVGDDETGEALLRYFQEKSVSTRYVVRLGGYLTPTKSRILGGLSHWQRQQIVRIGRSACDQCSFCTELCPRWLLGHPIEPHRAMRSLEFNLVGEANVVGTQPLGIHNQTFAPRSCRKRVSRKPRSRC